MSRQSMLQGLRDVPNARAALPFARLFYGNGESTYVWTDSHHRPHLIRQRGGGEQGDPLMPALFSLGLNAPLRFFFVVTGELQPTESGPSWTTFTSRPSHHV